MFYAHLDGSTSLVASAKIAIPIVANEYDTHEYSTMILNNMPPTAAMVSSSFSRLGNTVKILQ